MTQATSRDDVIRQDVADLHKLGYAQELFRSMGGFSNFAISFSIISILTGAVILYDYGLAWAGTAAVLIGWPLITVFVLAIAASMAEIASAYPTAGGLYYWASRMKNKEWGWWTAWLNLIGQFAIVAGINYAAAGFLNATLITPAALERCRVDFQNTEHVPGRPQRPARDDGHPDAHRARVEHRRYQPGRDAQPGQRVVAHRHRRGRGDPGVPRRQARRVGADAVRGPATQDTAGSWDNNLGFVNLAYGPAISYPLVLAFFFSLLQANWTYTGYDASAHVAEETVGARVASAWGIFLSVAVSAVVGFVFLLALTTHLPRPFDAIPSRSLDDAATYSQYYFGGGVAVIDILKYNLGQVGDLLSAGHRHRDGVLWPLVGGLRRPDAVSRSAATTACPVPAG